MKPVNKPRLPLILPIISVIAIGLAVVALYQRQTGEPNNISSKNPNRENSLAIGHLGNMAVRIPFEYAGLLEYDNDPHFLEDRSTEKQVRTFESGIRSLGFDVRFPDMAPVSKYTADDFLHQDIHTSKWLRVSIRANSFYGDNDQLVRLVDNVDSRMGHAYKRTNGFKYELEEYIPATLENNDLHNIDIYLHRNVEGATDTYIECRNPSRGAGFCKLSLLMEPQLQTAVDIRFQRSLLKDWRQIRVAVINIILSFRTKN